MYILNTSIIIHHVEKNVYSCIRIKSYRKLKYNKREIQNPAKKKKILDKNKNRIINVHSETRTRVSYFGQIKLPTLRIFIRGRTLIALRALSEIFCFDDNNLGLFPRRSEAVRCGGLRWLLLSFFLYFFYSI